MNPPPHHRRSHSDTTFRYSTLDDDDDFLLDLDNFTLDTLPLSPSPPPPPPSSAIEDDNETKPDKAAVHSVAPHVRSLSVEADFFEGVSFGGERKVGGGHRRTSSMDGGPGPSSMGVDGVKKAMPPETLAQLALIDPKRAKRILANRQSAARSKERKIRYTGELEKRVQTLQTKATTLSAQVTLLQRDTTGLTIENKELKLHLQALEQQAQLRDALNEALRQEVQGLRIATGQIPPSSNNSFGGGMLSQYQAQPHNAPNQSHPPPHAMHQQQQFQMADRSAGNNLGVHKQLKPNFMDFNHKG